MYETTIVRHWTRGSIELWNMGVGETWLSLEMSLLYRSQHREKDLTLSTTVHRVEKTKTEVQKGWGTPQGRLLKMMELFRERDPKISMGSPCICCWKLLRIKSCIYRVKLHETKEWSSRFNNSPRSHGTESSKQPEQSLQWTAA